MLRNKILLAIQICMCSVCTAVYAQRADLYVEDAVVAPGSEIVLPVKINNTEGAVAGFSCRIYLPEGFEVTKASRGSRLMTLNDRNEYETNFQSAPQADGSFMLLVYGGQAIPDTEGVVANVVVNIPNDAEKRDYEVVLKDIECSVESTITSTYTETNFILTVGEKNYAEGYSLQIIPFEAKAATDYAMTVNFAQVCEDVEEIEFDIVLPPDFTRTKVGRATKAPAFCNDDRIYDEDHSISMVSTAEGYHVTVSAITDDEYRVIAGIDGPLINLFFTSSGSVADGIYELELKNIIFTKFGGDIIEAAPYRASIYVGSPTLPSCITLYGNYDTSTSTLLNKIAGKQEVTCIDMSQIVDISPSINISPANKNMLTILPEGLSIAKEENVVIGSSCANLVLTDGYDFATPMDFTASVVSYRRSLTSEWGTIMLPFAVNSSEDVQYYKLAEVDVVNGMLTFEETTDAEANTPVVFMTWGSTLAVKGVNVDVPACEEPVAGETVNGLTLTGTLLMKTFGGLDSEDTTGIYYIRENKFWRGNDTLNIPAFHAYFEAEDATANVFGIADDPTGINGVIEVVDDKKYTLDGKQINSKLSNLKSRIIIKNRKKIAVK